MSKLKHLTLVLGFLLTAGCLAVALYEPWFIQAFSRPAYDALLRTRGVPTPCNEVAIVNVDQQSLKQYGEWPWSRHLLATLATTLYDAGASVLAFNIVFSEPDRTSPATVAENMQRYFNVTPSLDAVPPDLHDFDRRFASALKQGHTLLGCRMHYLPPGVEVIIHPRPDPAYQSVIYARGNGTLDDHILQAGGITLSILNLHAAAANSAFLNITADGDSVVRNAPLVWAYGDTRIYPSIALESVRLHRGIDQVGVEYAEDGIRTIRFGDRRIPTDRYGRLALNYRTGKNDPSSGVYRAYPMISAGDILAGRVDPALIKDRIIFIGRSDAGFGGLKATPLAANFTSVQIQATVADNILSGDFLQRPEFMDAIDLLAILIVGILLTIVIYRERSLFSFAITMGVIVVSVGASLLLLHKWSLVYVPTKVLFCVATLMPILVTIRFWQRERSEAWVRKTFRAMVSADVLKYMEADPRHLGAAGKRVEATMLFSDLAGFCRIAEEIDPAQLQDLLNMYLSPMTDIIMNREGYVDKYEGDLIMAVWGVPYAAPNHAVQACRAALEQVAKLNELKPDLLNRFGHSLKVRIGINTGRVVAGNMGTAERFQYTVVGDAVNIASRFESLNKEYGSCIIIGEATYKQVRNEVEVRLLDNREIPGTSHITRFYELLGMRGQISETQRKIVNLYEMALKASWEHQYGLALQKADELLAIEPRDMATQRLRRLVREKLAAAKQAAMGG